MCFIGFRNFQYIIISNEYGIVLSFYSWENGNRINISETTGILEQRNCVDEKICSPYADCKYDDAVRSFRCVCQSAYTGDGQTCTPTNEGYCCRKEHSFVT